MKTPKYLYHASSNRDIKVLEPRMQSIRDIDEGPVVFATPDKILATCFIVDVNDSWANMGLFGDIQYFVCSDEDRFRMLDKGGAIYVLDSKGFESDKNKGLGLGEWVSKTAVRPVEKLEYSSGLQAMLDSGVQVFFIDKETYKKVSSSEDGGYQILRNTMSENMKLKKNIRKIL